MQILEYILANYTWFLVGIVLILLAIVGYYADKTNFGQGKEKDSKENEHNKNKALINDNIEQLTIVTDESLDTADNSKVLVENLNAEKLNDETIENPNNFNDSNRIDSEIKSNTIENNEPQNVELIPRELPTAENEVKEEKHEDTLKISEEKFNMFSEEFEALMPKKNIINTDLLSDIEDLELDKTQKIDLNIVPDLDDIELPKIMELSTEDEDIWKI